MFRSGVSQELGGTEQRLLRKETLSVIQTDGTEDRPLMIPFHVSLEVRQGSEMESRILTTGIWTDV
jgi:hypothetical protein